MYSNSEYPSPCSDGGAAEIDRIPVHKGADVREDREMAAAARNEGAPNALGELNQISLPPLPQALNQATDAVHGGLGHLFSVTVTLAKAI
ncbi:hypothetical protein [Ensifer adhaerens]|uniref:Uncharacterized protein n=1 Tax=Ensifer adhaerens TaxID=106592 RepID=A0ABY8HN94_ENSAD|nr:hypothetical protein [Ensifer adhaerens]MDF8358737.1 hypothetical protein [Ensifer adhaerens]THA60755.1 hypothetical protein E5176_28230 [Ensifer adhaerens]WFP93015.1 hypothetical protein P4B07_25020 [Ensifer adhaerens]